MRDALGKMQKKKMPVELPREGEEFEETQMEEETQTEETQIAKRGREQEALDAADADQDEEDGASKGGLEEAQVDEGEVRYVSLFLLLLQRDCCLLTLRCIPRR